jgi:hypothetical protein
MIEKAFRYSAAGFFIIAITSMSYGVFEVSQEEYGLLSMNFGWTVLIHAGTGLAGLVLFAVSRS